MSTSTAMTPRLSFGGMLRSEWIKFVTLRSTVWCLAIVVAVTLALGALLSFALNTEGALPDAAVQQVTTQASTISIGFSQLAVIVLGALVITGEYGTGMIRSTFTSVPTRIPAVLAKALVFAVVVFVVSTVSIALSALISALVLPARGVHPDFGDPKLLGALVGGAGYLALMGVFAFALGTILRVSAGAIAAGLGVVLVLPGILQLLGSLVNAEWVSNLAAFLPSGAGSMYSYDAGAGSATSGVVDLTAWQGLAVIVVWDAVLLVIGSILVRSRDV